MWNFKLTKNDPKSTLGPPGLDPALRRPRIGSFEVLLSFSKSKGGGREALVLFSKLNTNRFPNPPDIISYLLRKLDVVRSTPFFVLVRDATTGALVPRSRGAVQVTDANGVTYQAKRSYECDRSVVASELHEFVLPFGKGVVCDARLADPGDVDALMAGSVEVDVHGKLLKEVCVPLVPPLPAQQVRLVLTWGR